MPHFDWRIPRSSSRSGEPACCQATHACRRLTRAHGAHRPGGSSGGRQPATVTPTRRARSRAGIKKPGSRRFFDRQAI